MSYRLAFFVLAILALSASTQAISFDTNPNQVRCFREQLTRHQVVSGEVGAPTSAFMQLKFWIENQFKRTLFNTEDAQLQTKFSFVADVDGEYQFCFVDNVRVNTYGSSSPRRVSFTYNTDDGPKSVKVANKANLKPLEAELLRIEQVAMHIATETTHQREREVSHRDTSETLNTRVTWFSILSVLILLGLSVAQVFYIQRYLKKTKWID